MITVSNQLPIKARHDRRSAVAYTVLTGLVCGVLVALPVRVRAQQAQPAAATPPASADPAYPVPPPPPPVAPAPAQPQYVPPPPPEVVPAPPVAQPPPTFQTYPAPQPLSGAELEAIRQQAKQDAAADTSGFGWFSLGCLIGAVGVVLGYVIAPKPPASRLIGKSPEQLAEYARQYRSFGRSKQGRRAIAGMIVGCAAAGVTTLVVYAAALATAVSRTSIR